jgi:hypothetical protein
MFQAIFTAQTDTMQAMMNTQATVLQEQVQTTVQEAVQVMETTQSLRFEIQSKIIDDLKKQLEQLRESGGANQASADFPPRKAQLQQSNNNQDKIRLQTSSLQSVVSTSNQDKIRLRTSTPQSVVSTTQPGALNQSAMEERASNTSKCVTKKNSITAAKVHGQATRSAHADQTGNELLINNKQSISSESRPSWADVLHVAIRAGTEPQVHKDKSTLPTSFYALQQWLNFKEQDVSKFVGAQAPQLPKNATSGRDNKCTKCKLKNHTTAECRKGTTPCSYCGKFNHTRKSCRKERQDSQGAKHSHG